MTPRQRLAACLFPLVALALLATTEAVHTRPMDGWSVVWFATAALLGATGTVITSMALLAQFRRDQITTNLDGFFWLIYLALPTCVSMLLTGVWTLSWYYLGSR